MNTSKVSSIIEKHFNSRRIVPQFTLGSAARRDIGGYLLVLPALALFAVFKIWPMIWGFSLSLYEWDGITAMKYVGLANYRYMLTDELFPKVVGNTLIYAFGIIIGNVAISLILALMVNRGLRGSSIFRTIYFMPPIMSFVMVGLLWAWIYNPQFGLVNSFLSMIGLKSMVRVWLADPQTALVSLMVIDIWKWSGWHMVVYLAGLQTISKEVIDAAKVDGATGFNLFRFITFPLLKPYTYLNIVLLAIGAFNTFDVVYVTTRGGPSNSTQMMLTYVNLVAFKYHKFGYAATLTYFLFTIVFGLSVLNLILWRRREAESN